MFLDARLKCLTIGKHSTTWLTPSGTVLILANSMEKQVLCMVTFPSHLKIVIFYTEIMTGKVVLWCFFSSKMSEKIHNSTFQVKISVQNVIFSNEMEKKPKYYTYFSIEFGKISFHFGLTISHFSTIWFCKLNKLDNKKITS